MKLTLVIIAAFIIWFCSVWVAVLSLLSIIGGWKTLGRLYPLTFTEMKNRALKYSMSSVRVGFVNYNYTVNIYFAEAAIILETIKIFSVMHKPLIIPYNRITGVERGKVFSTFTKFIVDDKKIIIYGKAGDELYSRLQVKDKSF